MRSVLRVVILAAVSLVAACDDSLPSEPVVSPRDERAGLQTRDLTVTLGRGSVGWEGRIPFTIRNVSAAPLHIGNCNGAYGATMERWESGRWRMVWANVIPLCRSPDIVVPPGDTLAQELRFFAAFDGARAQPAFDVSPPPRGTFRLRVDMRLAAGSVPDRWRGADERQVTSNPFTLVLP